MEELQQELMQTSEVGSESEQSQTQQGPTDSIADVQEQQEGQELWRQSNEFKSGLWKSPDDVFNSVRYYQQKLDPIRQTLEKTGFSNHEELEQVLSKYPEYKQNSEVVEKLNTLLTHEVYGPKLQSMFKEIQQGFEREKYGAAIEDLPPHVQEQFRKINEVEAELTKLKEEKELNNNIQTIHTQVESIQNICTNYGFEIDVQEFLKECQANNIPTNQMKAFFLEHNFDDLVAAAQKKSSLGVLNKNKEIKMSATSSSNKIEQTQAKEASSIKDLKEQLLSM